MPTNSRPHPKPVLGGHESVKVAIAQIPSAFLDRERCIERACAAMGEAAKKGAQLIVFPEVWFCGYPFWTNGWESEIPSFLSARIRFRDAALVIPSDDTDRLCRGAREANIHVVLGCNELDSRPEVETIYNTLLFIGRDGTLLGRHRKLHPTFVEKLFWGQGDGSDMAVYDTDIGRIGGLICGENAMTLARAAMIAQGEHIHIAAYPGSFALHKGPQLQEADTEGLFWGVAATRAHAIEAGAFVIMACGIHDEADVPNDFPYKGRMNTVWANGGSSVIAPIAVPVVPPTYTPGIMYADLQAMAIKAMKAIVDTMGHYARPDVLRLLVRRNDAWVPASDRFTPPRIDRAMLLRAADHHEVDVDAVHALAEKVLAPS
jgi:predicted amidohydrolase